MKGTVVDCVSDRNIDTGGMIYYPVNGYTVNDESYRVKSVTGASQYDPEKIMNVYYDPRNPQFSYVEGQNSRKTAIICLGSAVLLLAVAVFSGIMAFV